MKMIAVYLPDNEYEALERMAALGNVTVDRMVEDYFKGVVKHLTKACAIPKDKLS